MNRGDEIDIERLGFSKAVANKAYEIYSIVKDNVEIRGRAPSVIVATCVYIAGVICDEYLSQERIGRRFGRSNVAIRTCFHKIMELGILPESVKKVVE